MDKKLLATAFCVAIVSLAGCALTTDRIDIQSTPQPIAGQIPGANNVSVNLQVADLRQDKTKVSAKKNGYGMEMAPILATEDVAITVRRAIEQELRARGFKVASDAALVEIVADLTRYYNDFKMGFFAADAIADLNMSVTVKSKNGAVLYTRQVVAQGIEQNVMVASGENAKVALDRALANGMKALFEDQAFLAVLVASSAPKSAQK